jgi:hypothetical protein
MASPFGVRIVLQGGIAGATRDINAQLKEVEPKLKSLSVKIKIDSTSVENSTKTTTEATKKAKQQMSEYEKYINSVNTAFKKQSMHVEDYVKKMNRLISTQSFKQLSDEKQIRILQQLTQAESKLAQVQRTQRRVDSLQTQPTSQELYNKDISKQNSAYKAGRISAQEYINITDRIMAKTQQWEQADDRLRAKILQNREQINRANRSTQTQTERPINVGQIENTIQSLRNRMTNIASGSGAGFYNTSEFQNIQRNIDNLSQGFRTMTRPEIANNIGRIRNEIGLLNGEAQNASRSSMHLGDALYQAAVKFPLWMVVSTAFMQTFNGIKEGISYIYDLDNALNQIRIVTGQTSEEVQKLAVSYNALGQAMGVSTKEIAQTSVDLYRQGLALDDVNERMQGIIKYSKIAGIGLAESNKIITATMNNLGVSAQETIDVMSFIGDASAAGAEEVGVALQRSAATAAEAQISYQKVASWVATVSEKTRESAATIGNAVKFAA